jgi:hypothetical protein
MKYMMLIHQGTPMPWSSDEWESLLEDEQKVDGRRIGSQCGTPASGLPQRYSERKAP